MPIESPFVFYPRLAAETLRKARQILEGVSAAPRRCSTRSWRNPNRSTYTDLAIAPPASDEFDTLDMYHATRGGEDALGTQAS